MAFFRAYCNECGHTVKERESETFLDPFFLPERCPTCHAYKRKHMRRFEDTDNSGWLTSYGHWKRDVPFVLTKPGTWFASEKHWIDLDEARRAQEGKTDG